MDPRSIMLAVFAALFALASPILSLGPAQAPDSCPTGPNLNSRQGKNVSSLLEDESDCDCTSGPPPYSTLRGTVFDEAGKAAKGVRVRIESKASNDRFKVLTDGSGRYSYTGLKGGEYRTCVEYKGTVGLTREILLRNGYYVTFSDFDLKYFEAPASPPDPANR